MAMGPQHRAETPEQYLQGFMVGLKKRNIGQIEFHQAVEEFASSVIPFMFEHKKYLKAQILERMTEPDRIISFRVCWQDDEGNIRVNRGHRVQFNNSIGPYKGGLRFHSSVNESILKFLGFEQIFKNSLTGLPIGGGKGGANFNPKGKSDDEIMRFCQSFMTELYRHIGENKDVPAGDIGVGAREISFLYGQYKRIVGEVTGALTGKGIDYGGSLIRTEATGYGLVYFAEKILARSEIGLKGQVCLVSGSGNVAQYAAEKLLHKQAVVKSMSDTTGTLHFRHGLTQDVLSKIKDLKVNHQSLAELKDPSAEFLADHKPWSIACDFAFPCATENEVVAEDVRLLEKNGCRGLFEGANMPCTAEAVKILNAGEMLYGPCKAANAGGVAISALEMSQNNIGVSWKREHVDGQLREIMTEIYDTCVKYGRSENTGKVCFATGANIGGFVKVANAMLAFGIV